ncbi:hypothetical protein Pcinc_021095 [Petrolisthes cinctipes]|uniref:Uncharacterized protein n=1 Tax=Petrolisthes cinctipes TaxID=88211 RepID=A0AAE1KIW4_PETCI|nr:hypothetical protein Pcinc_021095 [Petrolisthes cinctipes]
MRKLLNKSPQATRSLKADAVPSLFLPKQKEDSESAKHRRRRAEEKQRRQLLQDLLSVSDTSQEDSAPIETAVAGGTQQHELYCSELAPDSYEDPTQTSAVGERLLTPRELETTKEGSSASSVSTLQRWTKGHRFNPEIPESLC